jgi:hypothetical protein
MFLKGQSIYRYIDSVKNREGENELRKRNRYGALEGLFKYD